MRCHFQDDPDLSRVGGMVPDLAGPDRLTCSCAARGGCGGLRRSRASDSESALFTFAAAFPFPLRHRFAGPLTGIVVAFPERISARCNHLVFLNHA